MATDSEGKTIKIEPIKHHADYQKNWAAAISPVSNKFIYRSAKSLSIHGDAPKNLISKYEYEPGKIRRGKPERWPRFIAKVGSKFYPNESITEHLLTRVGQILQLRIADSELRMVGRQVRFMSRYFLGPSESLIHGAELFMRLLDRPFVNKVTERKSEKEFFTFQTICEAVEDAFPRVAQDVVSKLVRMMAFDAIIGHMDRHAFNWGVVAPVSEHGIAQFAPIFDTARALFWNIPEDRIDQMITDHAQFEAYIAGSRPQIGWDGSEDIGHFELLEALHDAYPGHRKSLQRLIRTGFLSEVREVLNTEFGDLMTSNRRRLIERCLKERYARYRQSITG
jgi:hypothetical protein